ncbi:MAG: hypothetical protein SFT92_08250 [Rickettsiales bacterium]|nr:hypothetical protein [Rickettsiales bacterium]
MNKENNTLSNDSISTPTSKKISGYRINGKPVDEYTFKAKIRQIWRGLRYVYIIPAALFMVGFFVPQVREPIWVFAIGFTILLSILLYVGKRKLSQFFPDLFRNPNDTV